MISTAEILALHEKLNVQFWGAAGLRDERALEAALARPLATFGGQDLYPGTVEKASALAESLIKNHPFVEGNMRTAYVLLRLLLLEAGRELTADEEDRHAFILSIATSQRTYPELVNWLYEHSRLL